MEPPPRFLTDKELKGILKAAKQSRTNPATKIPLTREQLLQRCLELQLIRLQDAAVPPGRYYSLQEARQLLNLPGTNKEGRDVLLQRCLEQGLIREQDVSAKATRKRAAPLDPETKAQLRQHAHASDGSYTVTRNLLENLLQPASKAVVMGLVEDAVCRTQLIVLHAYQMLKLWFLHTHQAGEPLALPSSDLCLYMLYGVSKEGVPSGPGGDPALRVAVKDFYLHHYRPLLPQGHQPPTRHRITNVLCYESRAMATHYSTNLKTHFAEHVRRWVNSHFHLRDCAREISTDTTLTGAAKKAAKKALWATYRVVKEDLMDGSPQMQVRTQDPQLAQWVLQQRQLLLPEGPFQEESVAYDVKVRPEAYLAGSLKLAAQMEGEGLPLFAAVPQRTSDIPCHITLDTLALKELLGVAKGKDKLSWEVKRAVWSEWFKVEARCFRRGNKLAPRFVFRGMLKTDGVSASVLLIRSDLRHDILVKETGKKKRKRGGDAAPSEEEVRYLGRDWPHGGRRLVAGDPGKDDILYMGDSQGQYMRYTKCQRRRESKALRYEQIRQQLHEATGALAGRTVQEWQSLLAGYRSRSIAVGPYSEWIRAKAAATDALGAHWSSPSFRRLRFNQWVNLRRSEDLFIKRFRAMYGGPGEVLVGLGDHSAGGGGKHLRHSPPTKRQGLHPISRRNGYDTALLGEYLTTQRCSICRKGRCQPYKHHISSGTGKDRKAHGLLRCDQCCAHHNRNKNAVRNQLRVGAAALAGEERPANLRRRSEPQF